MSQANNNRIMLGHVDCSDGVILSDVLSFGDNNFNSNLQGVVV